jgi:hypothetical protein
MNRVLLPILFVLLLLSPVSALGMLKVTVIPKDPTAGEEVRIIVTTAVTNEPVAGAKIYIKSDVLGKTLIGETDSNGELRYVFEEPGTYRIRVEKEGYTSIPVESGEVVVVKPKGALKLTVTEVEVVEEQGKVKQVTNIYVTANGNPVEGAEIYVNDKFIGYTDSNGLLTYKFEPGAYVIVAKKTGYLPSAGFSLNVNEEELRKKLREKVEEIREKLPPIILMKDLYPKHFVIGDDESYTVSAIICDEKGLKYAKLLYSTDGVNWKEAESSVNTLTSAEIPKLGLEFKITPPQIYEVKGTIPLQKAGTVIFYKFVAEDEDGNKAESPTGMYFVVDDENDLRIVIVDPWVELWLYKLNAEKYADTIKNMTSYKIKIEWLNKAFDEAEKAKKFDLIKRHYWERIGKYNFIIVDPDEVEESLSFKPKVFVLSNLMLSRWVVPHELIEYARENNAGIVATHGTIFDEVVWTECKRENAIEVGARKHVGDKLEDYDQETVALLLGLKLSPLIEYARDRAAEMMCASKDPQVQTAGRALGSIPLHPAYVPFSGKIMVEEDHEVVKGLGKEFQITIPSMYERKFKAYTTFGWQYVLPSEPVRVAKERAKIAKEKAREIYDELSEFTGNYMGSRTDTDVMLSSLDSKLLDSALDLSVEDGKVKVRIEDREVEFDAGRAKPVVEFFKKYMPVKVVAISDDYLAGVIVHDEWFRGDGIRAVYITFEVEASGDNTVWSLMENSVVWVSKFDYKAQEVTKEMAELLEEMVEEAKSAGEGATQTMAETPASEVTVTPGFEAVLAVAGMFAVAYLLEKRS